MPEKRKAREISELYLELASECFDKSVAAEDPGASETMRRMGRSYVARARALNPSLDAGQLSEANSKIRRT